MIAAADSLTIIFLPLRRVIVVSWKDSTVSISSELTVMDVESMRVRVIIVTKEIVDTYYLTEFIDKAKLESELRIRKIAGTNREPRLYKKTTIIQVVKSAYILPFPNYIHGAVYSIFRYGIM